MRPLFRILALALLCGCVAVQAQPAGLAQSEVRLLEVPDAPPSFSRGTPVPSWVQRVAVPQTQRDDSLVVRLADVQIRLADSSSEFIDLVVQANDAAALHQIGQFKLAYDPAYQTLHLHAIAILRAGAALDRTAGADIRFLERETGFEQGVYSGDVTVAILLPDVRVGDALQLTYTIEGANPVFSNLYADLFNWDREEPVERRRLTITYPQERPIRWRVLGDYPRAALVPRVTQDGDLRTLQFEESGVEGLPAEPFVPDNYFEHRRLQLTEFRDWNHVARWAQALFPVVGDVPDELQAVISRLSALPDTTARAAAALAWVQGEIRNFSMSLGESSHRPHAPHVVLRRRYGDCKDKTYLLLTMLRHMGIEATPMLVSNSLPRAPGKVLPTPQAFDHVVLQVRIDGTPVYLDATHAPQPVALQALSPPPARTLGLLADGSVQRLTAVGPSPRGAPESFEIEERLRLPALAPAGTIETHALFTGKRAEQIRSLWAVAQPGERRQMALGFYDRRYQGIVLDGEPEALDDTASNRFTIVARFAVPGLARLVDGAWRIAFEPSSLVGTFNVPRSLQRRFPLAATEFPMGRKYNVVVEWPPQVSADRAPSSQVLDGPIFHAESRTVFRGRRYEYTVALHTTASDVDVGELPRLLEDIQQLSRLTALGVTVYPREIGEGPTPGLSSVQAAVARHARDMIDQATAVIVPGDVLAEALCLRAQGLGYLERLADGLRDSTEAVRVAPSSAAAWACHGDLLYRQGDFAQADEAFTRAMALGGDASDALFGRGVARFYAGREDEAAADLAKAASTATDEEARIYKRTWQAWSWRRAGRALPPELFELAGRDPRGPWPRPALALLAGQLTTQQMLAEVDRLQGDERELALAEAWFYAGQSQLLQGRIAETRASFAKCREIGVTNYHEHVGAGFELARLSAASAPEPLKQPP